MNKLKNMFLTVAFIYGSVCTTCAQNINEKTNVFAEIDNSLKELNIEMVTCPAGSFLMGSPKTELGRNEPDVKSIWYNPDTAVTETQHKVNLTKDFQIGKYEVTQKQFNEIMGRNPSEFKDDNFPVTNITKWEADEFCKALNEKYSKVLPKGYKFGLPTEAQWEYACRAGSTSALNNNKEITTVDGECPNLDEVAWYKGNMNGRSVHTVGQKKPNAWGIYDMHGNAMEICSDAHQNYTEQELTDPVGTPQTAFKGFLYKGGDCRSKPEFCRSASKTPFKPRTLYANSYMGMRLAIIPAE